MSDMTAPPTVLPNQPPFERKRREIVAHAKVKLVALSSKRGKECYRILLAAITKTLVKTYAATITPLGNNRDPDQLQRHILNEALNQLEAEGRIHTYGRPKYSWV